MLRKTLLITAPGALLACSGLAAAATGLPWASSFETGDITEWRGGYDKNDTGVSVTTDPEAVFRGRYGLKIPLRPDYINDNYIELPFGDHPQFDHGRGRPVDEVWLSFRVKFVPGPGYDRSNFWVSRSSHKMALVNLEDADNRRRNQVYVYVGKDGRFHVDWSDIDNWRFEEIEALSTPPRVRFGEWHEVKLRVKNNHIGRADGVVELWIDGDQVVHRTDLAIRRDDRSGKDKKVHPNLVILSSYTNAKDGGAGTQYFDDWYIGETDPDAAATSRPKAQDGV